MTGPTAPLWPHRSWLGLYYDLAFVAAIIVLSGAYARDYSAVQVGWLVLVFAILWTVWLLAELLDGARPTSAARVLLIAVQMTVVLSAAVTSDDSLEDNTELVGPLFGTAVLSLVALARLDGGTAARGRAIAQPLAAGVLLLLTPLYPGQAYLAAWLIGLGLLADTARRLVARPMGDRHRWSHRLGELTLIVMGEAFVKVGLVAAENDLSDVRAVALLVIFGLVTLLWWDYFSSRTRLGLAPGRRGSAQLVTHLPLHLGIVGAAAGMGKLLVGSPELSGAGAAQFLAGPVAFCAASLALMDYADGPTRSSRRLLVHALTAGTAALITTVATVR